MTGRAHWENCLTHFDEGVEHFIAEYFSLADRKCLLIAGAGFDPRARLVADRLAVAMGHRLCGLFVREDRGDPAINLRKLADENEERLRSAVNRSQVETISIFSPDDYAAIGGQQIVSLLQAFDWPKGLTDIVAGHERSLDGRRLPRCPNAHRAVRSESSD